MRLCDVDEHYITGKASDEEKFYKYAEIMPKLIGNPLYYWTHFELQKVFGIYEPLNKDTAHDIYQRANKVLKNKTVRSLLKEFNVEYIATTNDPLEKLNNHGDFDGIKVRPTFRPDKLLTLDSAYLKELSELTNIDIKTIKDLKRAISIRLDYFVSKGCKISDHGFLDFPMDIANEEEANHLFDYRDVLDKKGRDCLSGYLLRFLMEEYKKRDMAVQLHFAVTRNINTSMYQKVGVDAGFDVIAKEINYQSLIKFLDSLDDEHRPTIILYSLNPNTIAPLACISGAYRHVYVGAAWWFNDTLNGIKRNLDLTAEYALLGTNLGMLTDSRSFSSYVRFDFFRRILCSYIANKVEAGEYDINEASKLARDICYNNIKNLLKI
jgi:glucuronate isomerase